MNNVDRNRVSLAPEADELLAVAGLGRPHGLHGEVRARSFAPDVVDFLNLLRERDAWLRRPHRPPQLVRITGGRPHGGRHLLLIEGYNDRAAAETLNNGELCLTREQLPELPGGWFWEADLVGLEVHDRRLGRVGRSVGLEAMGVRWLLQFELEDGGRVLVPWAESLILKVDLGAERIELDLPRDYPGISRPTET